MKFICLLLCIMFIQSGFSQNNNETYLYEFDKLVHSYSSDLNTGKRFEDLYFRNLNDGFRFFVGSTYVLGKINYNGQDYSEANLKYDLLDDNLIYKNTTGINKYDVILEKSLVNAFTVYDRTFLRLPVSASKLSFYNNGYFEIVLHNKEYDLYLKHQKFNKEKLGDKSVYYVYSTKESIVLGYQNKFFEIDAKNDILKILPDKKLEIKDFYKNHQNLESNNKIEFMKQLFAFLSLSN